MAPQEQSVVKALLGYTVSLVWAFGIAFFYGVIMAFSPLIYVNYFITLAFGLILGYGVRFTTTLFKITHKSTAIGMAVACSAFGLIFSWAAYVIYFLEEGSIVSAYFIELKVVKDPGFLIDVILDINKNGLWEIFGITFTGWILTIIWLAEAGIIITLCTLMVKNQTQSPFSINLNKWYKRFILEKDFESIAMKEAFKESLATDCVKTIDSLQNGLAFHFSRISVFYLAKEERQYIMVENVRKDRRGKSENSTEVIPLIVVSSEQAAILIEKYHATTPGIFDY